MAKLTAGDILPISIVEGEGLCHLIAFLEPEYTVPCSQTITARLEKMYTETAQFLRNILSTASCHHHRRMDSVDDRVLFNNSRSLFRRLGCEECHPVDTLNTRHSASKLTLSGVGVAPMFCTDAAARYQ